MIWELKVYFMDGKYEILKFKSPQESDRKQKNILENGYEKHDNRPPFTVTFYPSCSIMKFERRERKGIQTL